MQRTFQQLIKVGRARPDSTFRRVFTSLMIPSATEEQAGWLDAEVARELALSVRTVERHLTGVYTKLGLSGRSARAAAVARLLAG